MLNKQSLRIWPYVVVGLVLGAALLWAISSFFGLSGEICPDKASANNGDCPRYNLLFSGLWYLTETTNWLSPAITALATAAIGYFTFTLWKSGEATGNLADRQFDLAERQFLMEGVQAATLEKQKEIQRQQVLALHRPKLIVREVYWDAFTPSAVTFILVNQGVHQARIVESQFHFDRSDERPIIPNGGNMLDPDFSVLGGEFRPITRPIMDENGVALAAFDMGFMETVNFQGVIIYSDEWGPTLYRTVFKRACDKGETIFRRTGNPDDEYSD